MKLEHVDEIIRETFGLWITAFFGAISSFNPEITFDQHKHAFFELLEQLLDQGKVKFCPPNEIWREGYDVWEADASTILEYLKARWPADVTSERDAALNDYFYDIPAILWVAADGSLHGS